MSKIYEALQRVEQGQDIPRTRAPENNFDDHNLKTFSSDRLVVLTRPGSVAAEQFRFLRSQIIRPQDGVSPKTILITSSLQGEGKTFTSCNLAATIALGLDEYVLLVDADLRNPMVHNVFGLERPEKGLSTYLEHNEPLNKLLRKTAINKLSLLPAGQETENPAELLSSRRMQSLIKEVGDRYPDRLVIFDSPPINLAPESLSLANEVDAVFLLVQRGKTSRWVAKSTIERLQKEKLKGVIFNQDPKIASIKNYSYGYGYGYSYGKDKGKS